ncbi:MAG: flagellar basal body L-ring protein FlgH [Deltaproteobacteria bacterium]|nr:flagellar basal body L-ring protein FlgH [Deltaproteobacteria bacterium]
MFVRCCRFRMRVPFRSSYVLLILGLAGCAGGAKEIKKVSPPQAPVVSVGPEVNYDHRVQPKRYEGSLWQEKGALSSLFKDYKASNVGDVVTVYLDPESKLKGESGANTDISRKGGVGGSLKTGWSGTNWKAGDYKGSVNTELSNNSKGGGKTTRTGLLTGTITARVVKVLPDGNLVIVGGREITVNDETQDLLISGIIQPRDIRYEPKKRRYEVYSSCISDAKFVYKGRGVINQRQRPGWFSNLFNVLSPF